MGTSLPGRVAPNATLRRTLLGLAVFGLIAQGVPSMASHAYNQEYLAGLETAWRCEFIAGRSRRTTTW